LNEALDTARDRFLSSAELDEPWQRLAWIIPLAVLLWATLLTGFGLLLERTAPPPPELAPAQVRIVEIPPAAGLAGGAPVPAQPHPHLPAVIHRPVIARPKMPHLTKPQPMPEVPASESGTAKGSTQPPAASGSASAMPSNEGAVGGAGSGGGAGLGSDSGGARAILAPPLVIPDDLREEVLNTVAIAHFKVTYDGQVQVTLIKPTESPRLNQSLLDQLNQYRYFPAQKNGVTIDSEFDVRIPVSVD
jgi:periplasmic protein TonB